MDIKIQKQANVKTADLLEKFGYLFIPSVIKKGNANLPPICHISFAMVEKKMIGLAVSVINQQDSIGKLINLGVLPEYRGQGIAQGLLDALDELLVSHKVQEIKANFRSHWKHTPHVAHILKKKNWSEPEVELIIVDGLAANVLQLFSNEEAPYPNGYYSKPWKTLSADELKHLRLVANAANIPQDQHPFIAENSINTETSLILYYNDDIVGWVISHAISRVTNEFTAYYIDKEHRSFRLAHKLMRETIFRQHELTDLKNFIIAAKSTNALMSSFLLRHAEKTEVKLIKTLKSIKAYENQKVQKNEI